MQVKRVLLSVSDKTGIVDLARGLAELGVSLLSSGGTAATLRDAGLDVTDVSDYTGQPEILEGRVKTLHPKIAGGLLGRRDKPSHIAQMEEQGIEPIDMAVVNLYPFEKTISKSDVTLEDAIENIDIGGPTLIRAAAKNHESVAVVVNPDRYSMILEQLKENSGSLSQNALQELAVEAFAHTAEYDALIYNWLHQKLQPDELFPEVQTLRYRKSQSLRYGENPHQQACFYSDPSYVGVCIPNSEQLHGRELSYNNILDLESSLDIVREFKEPAAAVIKHTNPCGVAVADNISEAYRIAESADPLSAYGSVIALNREVDEPCAQQLRKHFIEAIIAPGFHPDALAILKKKKSIRLLQTSGPISNDMHPQKRTYVRGGLLLQSSGWPQVADDDLKVVTELTPTPEQYRAFDFGYRICRHIKSNTVILVGSDRTLGLGVGQMSRVDASIIAARKAGDAAAGSTLISDAFFPFRDGVDAAAGAGVAAILQPGGSIRDQEVIDAANEHGMAMVFSGVRLFKH